MSSDVQIASRNSSQGKITVEPVTIVEGVASQNEFDVDARSNVLATKTVEVIKSDFQRSPCNRARTELTSFVDTTPRHRGGPTVTSFQNTSGEEDMTHRFKHLLDEGTFTGGDDTSELNGSVFLSSSSEKDVQSRYNNKAASSKEGKSHHSTSISLKIGMVALKNRKGKAAREPTSFGDTLGSPSHGHELEYLIDMLKSLQNTESQLEKTKEKLIMRCIEFNNKEAMKLFEPPEEKDENMHFFNVKKAFKKVKLSIETYQAK